MLRLESGLELPPEQMLVLANDTNDVYRAERFTVIAKEAGIRIVKIGLELLTNVDVTIRECSEIAADNRMEWVADPKLEGTIKTLPMAIGNYVKLAHPPIGITVSAQSGVESLRLAQLIANQKGIMIFAVGLLSTIGKEETEKYYQKSPTELMIIEASRGVDAGVRGMVTSAEELPLLKSHKKTKGLFSLVVGTRSRGVMVEGDDQVRTSSIYSAVAAGGDLIEIGREATDKKSSVQIKKAIYKAQTDVADGLRARAA